MGSLIHLVVVGLYPYLVINSSYLINDTLPHAVVAFQDNVCTQFPRSVNWFLKLFFGCLLKQAVKLRANVQHESYSPTVSGPLLVSELW